MRKVLILTYSFPPEGGPAVQRVAKFAKYIPRYGYQPVVLTSKHPVKIRDESLMEDVKQVQIYSTIDFTSFLVGEIRKWIKKLLVPDKQVYWKKTALPEALKIIENEGIDLIFSSSPPHSVHLIAAELKKKTGLPWVADFRDEWTQHPDLRKKCRREMIIQFEKNIVENCDSLITVTDGAKNNFQAAYPDTPIFYIPNGFDPDDLPVKPYPKKTAPEFSFIYTGRLNHISDPREFFKAFSILVERGNRVVDNLKIDIYGPDENRKWILGYSNLERFINFYKYLPHKEVLTRVDQADAALLFVSQMTNAAIFTGKVFEYFFLKKPILAVIDNNEEMENFLLNYGPVYIGYNGNIESVVNAIRNLVGDLKNSAIKNVSEEFVLNFSRDRLASQLAEVFNSLIAR